MDKTIKVEEVVINLWNCKAVFSFKIETFCMKMYSLYSNLWPEYNEYIFMSSRPVLRDKTAFEYLVMMMMTMMTALTLSERLKDRQNKKGKLDKSHRRNRLS